MRALYPKIPHLPGSRTGKADRHVGSTRGESLTRKATVGACILVEEKLDGTCVVVVREGTTVLAHGRDGRPAHASRNLGRRLFARWVDEHREQFLALLEDGEHACGEWLPMAHGTRYSLTHEPFVLFDLVRSGKAVCRDRLFERANRAELSTPCILHTGSALSTDVALELLGIRGHHGADAAEGVVYREEWPDKGECSFVAKLVRMDKIDGLYLADHTKEGHVFNTWPGSDAWLARMLSEDARAGNEP